MIQNAYYLKRLKEDFSRRKRDRSTYSLRAFARDLEIHPSTLSQVLHGNRPLPLKNSSKAIDALRLNAKERTLFIDSLGKKHILLDQIKLSEEDDRFILDETYFQIIAEWEHYAVLTLFDCDGFDPTPQQIAGRLAISSTRAEVVLENLLRYGLLQRTSKGGLKKEHPKVRTTEDVASQALRASHRDTIDLSKRKLEEISVELRDFSSLMVALDLEKLPEAKTVIREFRQKMSKLLKAGKKNHVYQLAIQFYPLTNVEKPEAKPLQTAKKKRSSV